MKELHHSLDLMSQTRNIKKKKLESDSIKFFFYIK